MKSVKEKEQIHQAALERQKLRMKIANTVKRNNIDTSCFSCGKPGKILHNFINPYKITFICDECRKDPSKLIEAEKHRFDLQTVLDNTKQRRMKNRQVKQLSIRTIKKTIDDYLKTTLSVGKYCQYKNISRHQFNIMLTIYENTYPNIPIRGIVENKSKRTQKILIQNLKDTKRILKSVK